MHPVENLRGLASRHLEGRRIVLGVSGSIGAVKCVELARELGRHGARVHAVMSDAALGILTEAAMEFATGNPVVTKLTGQVEHVQLLGDVPEKADLLLIAPATANTVSKMALGIDDSPVTTCATVAFGTRTPVVVAPAMHEAMLQHPIVGRHARALVEELGVTWVEPLHEEKKAKLAPVEAIVEAVIHRLAQQHGPLAGKSALVVGGATAEPVDPMRVLTNRSSGQSALVLARELRRLGAHVRLWYGNATAPVTADLEERTLRYSTHADLVRLVESLGDGATDDAYDQVWMPAAINDYAPEASPTKLASEQDLTLTLRPLGKIIESIRARLPRATLVAFKAESDADALLDRARGRLERYGAQFIIANTARSFGAHDTEAWLLGANGLQEHYEGPKETVLAEIARRVAEERSAP